MAADVGKGLLRRQDCAFSGSGRTLAAVKSLNARITQSKRGGAGIMLTIRRQSRREVLKAGAIGLLGLGMTELSTLRGLANAPKPRARSVIFVFLTGGLSHLDSFDLKPDAPDTVRGEFQPIATRTPGIRICEHLPLLAQRSDKYAMIRSMATGSDGHEVACHMLLTGRLDLPAGFSLQNV